MSNFTNIFMVYHYTSIKTLGLILKNRKIRFTRFDLLDDRTEVEGLPELLKKRYFLDRNLWAYLIEFFRLH